MSLRVEASIAFAQLMQRRRQTLVSVMGVSLGVAFFIATFAIMQGSEKDFVDRLVNNSPHITIKDEFRTPTQQPVFRDYPSGAISLSNVRPKEYLRGIKNYREKVDELSQLPGVIAEAALSGPAIVRFANKDVSSSVDGIDPDKEKHLTKVAGDMIEGDLDKLKTASNGIVIGYGMVLKLGLKVGDLATVISSTGAVRLMKVVGIYRTGNLLMDEGQIYMLLKDAQVLLNKPYIANQIRIRVPVPDDAETLANQLETRWGYRSESWQEVNRDLLGLFIIRNSITYSIVSAIMIVASFGIFNIISTVVMEKRRDIAIMMSMGFRAADIQRIFLVQGLLVGLLGMAIGWTIGFCILEGISFVKFTVPGVTEKQGFVLDKGLLQYLISGSFALGSAVIAAWFPARKASRVRPVEIIRGAA